MYEKLKRECGKCLCRAKKSGVHVRTIVRPMGTVNDVFFLSVARPIKRGRSFVCQFPALGVCSVLTSQLLNNKSIVVDYSD